MDQYRTWLSGLKRALLYQDDETLTSTLNITPGILSGIPEDIRHSTFIGQPGLMQSLSNLQRALKGSGQSVHDLKTAITYRIQQFEQTKSPPIPAALPALIPPSPLPCPLPPSSEFGHSSAEAVDLTRGFIASRNTGSDAGKVGHCQRIPAPDGQRETFFVSSFDDLNARDLHSRVPTAVEVKLPSSDGFVPPCERGLKPYTKPMHSPRCSRRREGSSHSLDQSKRFRNPFQDAAADRAAAKDKNKEHDSSENFPAEMKEYDADLHSLRMGQGDVRLTQTFTGEQYLAAKYHEFDMLATQHINFHDEWKEKLADDTDWRNDIDGKLQTILDLLRYSVVTTALRR